MGGYQYGDLTQIYSNNIKHLKDTPLSGLMTMFSEHHANHFWTGTHFPHRNVREPALANNQWLMLRSDHYLLMCLNGNKMT